MDAIKDSSIIVYPTDTVWGIGGCILNYSVFQKIEDVKSSAKGKPVSIMFSGIQAFFNTFKLPDNFKNEWFKRLFEYEISVLIPIAWIVDKESIPGWIYGESKFISTRISKSSIVSDMIAHIGSPIISTSLNKTGEQAIIGLPDAKCFIENYCPEALLISDDNKNLLSGHSSTLIKIEENKEVLIIREGLQVNEIKSFCAL